MAYDAQKTFADFEREVQTVGNDLIRTLYRCEELFKDMSVFAAGRTNSEIALALGVDVDFINDLQAAVVAFHRIVDYAEGNSQTAGQHLDLIRVFT